MSTNGSAFTHITGGCYPIPKRHPYDPLATSLKRSVRTAALEINSKIIDSELFCQDPGDCDSACEIEAAVSDNHYHLHHAECSPSLAALWVTLIIGLCIEVDHFEIK